jgi:large-conductance mechanosensitive channel
MQTLRFNVMKAAAFVAVVRSTVETILLPPFNHCMVELKIQNERHRVMPLSDKMIEHLVT